MSQMEKVPVQLTVDNIKYIKSKGSFAKVLNFLVQEMRLNKSLEEKINKLINT